MAGITDLSVAFGNMTYEQKSQIYDEFADDTLFKEYGNSLPRPNSHHWYGNIDSNFIEEFQEKVLDFMTRIGVKWRAATREMDDFDAGWWEEDGHFHYFDPFEGFDPG